MRVFMIIVCACVIVIVRVCVCVTLCVCDGDSEMELQAKPMWSGARQPAAHGSQRRNTGSRKTDDVIHGIAYIVHIYFHACLPT